MPKGRPRKPDSSTISFRINGSTVRQLREEAKGAKKPLGTYVRHLLEAYAPGKDGAETQEKADRLREVARRA